MSNDPELEALSSVNNALQGLDRDAQQRVLDYVSKKLGVASASDSSDRSNGRYEDTESASEEATARSQAGNQDDDLDGISPIAQKWIRRSGLSVDQLGKLFSLGVDEIDVVSKSIPGQGKKQRARSIALLKGLAAYLSTGVARVTAEQIKEACLHYDAFDSTNHAKYLKSMAAELSGTKSGGFTLTPRGITAGTELIKEMLGLTANSKE